MKPDYTFFKRSQCEREYLPGEYFITCRSAGSNSEDILLWNTVRGLCPAGSFCVDDVRNGRPTAFCTSQPSFTDTVKAWNINGVRRVVVQGADPQGGQILQLLLATPAAIPLLFKAHQITLMPTDADGNILAQPAVCSACSSLIFTNTPPRTTRLEIHIIMPDAADTAKVFGYVWHSENHD